MYRLCLHVHLQSKKYSRDFIWRNWFWGGGGGEGGGKEGDSVPDSDLLKRVESV